MNLTEEQKKEIDLVESKVCKYFGVSPQDVINFDTRDQVSLARAFIFYIVHVDMKVSISCICNLYIRKPNSVFKSVSKTKGMIKNQKAYREMYDKICSI